ncbi:TIGR03546 family protein [Breznakiella homolactica]|uniref:TIGR03546 family protein n=1 Tax=Breznakiella homolactica TaxID=2798577 RepID=A0A7T8BBH7_9SPIR|nr:TIGR03546 family protein [Breznakiella homolactica]QQO10416.1 TIGR03546 family protein [Breznakiella homolactica]
MIKAIAKLIVALNGNVKASQIAAGFAWGLLLALVPVGIIWVVLFIVSFFFKHNHASKLLVMAVFKLIGPLTAIPLDLLGWEILHIEALRPGLTVLYNTPLVPFTKFNNTLVAGGLAAGIVLWIPVYCITRALIPLYRNTLAPRIRESRFVKAVKKVPLISSIAKAVSSLSDVHKAVN